MIMRLDHSLNPGFYTITTGGVTDDKPVRAVGELFALTRLNLYASRVDFQPHSAYHGFQIYRAYHMDNQKPAALYIAVHQYYTGRVWTAVNLAGIKESCRRIQEIIGLPEGEDRCRL